MKIIKRLLITAVLSLLILMVTGCSKGEKTVVEEKMIIGNDYRLPYFEFGTGEKNFVLLPGASMTSILGSEEGIRIMFAKYSEDFHIYVFDVPEDLESVTGIDHLADIIADALDLLGVKEADVYGASMGGMIAQELTIRHPELVRSLTLASSMSRNNEMSNEVFETWSNTADPAELSKQVNVHVYSSAYYEKYSEIFHSLEAAATVEGVNRLHELVRLMKTFSTYDELDRIKCPVYVYTGSADNTLSSAASVEIAEKLGCAIKVFEGYSHAVYDEYPGFYDDVFANLK